jgi:putative protease
MSSQNSKKIGEITHFFGKIKVGVIKLSDNLKVGDKIRIVGGEREFDQTVESMEVDKEKIKKAKKGDAVGLKLKGKAREGYEVFKL